MTDVEGSIPTTRRIASDDPVCGFRSGVRALDDYFRRYALANDERNIGRTYVLDATPDDLAHGLPEVIGFYTLSMASVVSGDVASVMRETLPRYPMPVGLIGRLAVDERTRGRGLGEALLLDALRRVIEAAEIVACVGVIVDAKDEDAERFYAQYDFVTVESSSWPRRMFLAIQVARAVFTNEPPK